ncbi:MAG: sugar transferase [Bacteroidales bacterium]
MLKDNERLYNNAIALLDIALSLIAFYIAYSVRVYIVAKQTLYSSEYILLGALLIPTWFVLLKIISVQSSQKVKAYSVVFMEYAMVILLGTAILFVFIFAFKLDNISRIAILIFGVSNLLLLFISKVLLISYEKSSFLKGKNVKQLILIADESSEAFIERMIEGKHLGYIIGGIVTDSPSIIQKYSDKFRLFSEKENLDKIMEENVVDEVIYCKNEVNSQQIKRLIYSCAEIGVCFHIQSELFSLIASKSHMNYMEEIPVMTFDVTSVDYFALSVKRLIDYLISFFALLFFLPFSVIIALLIKAESKGPVLYKQKRVGLHGRSFTMYKFRTMVQNSEALKKELNEKNEADGPVFKIKNDPRVTKIGGFLRKTSLDEFPQFLNVIRGEMAIVGPRPPVPEEVVMYERPQLRRLSVKPGITCIWQVSGRNNIGFDEWMKLDLQYIDNWSLKLDIFLILKTINAIYKRTGY